MWKVVVASLALTACWTGKPAPLQPHAPPVAAQPSAPSDDYRDETIAADALGVAAMTAGLITIQRHGNSDVGGALLVIGASSAGFGDPIIHLAHGRPGRAGASYLARMMTTTMGLMIGAGADCRDLDLDCKLGGMFWGMTGGLAVAGVVDALLLHGQVQTWTPTVTPHDGGAQVGLARPW